MVIAFNTHQVSERLKKLGYDDEMVKEVIEFTGELCQMFASFVDDYYAQALEDMELKHLPPEVPIAVIVAMGMHVDASGMTVGNDENVPWNPWELVSIARGVAVNVKDIPQANPKN